jgi:probable HAF family extracellular repeat protein
MAIALLTAGAGQASAGYSFTDLGPLGGQFSRANAINNAGQIVGYSYTAGNASFHAMLWQGATATDLGALGGRYSEAKAINNAGLIVGNAYTAAVAPHAALWSGATVTDLGAVTTPVRYSSDAYGINIAGRIAGLSGQNLTVERRHGHQFDVTDRLDHGDGHQRLGPNCRHGLCPEWRQLFRHRRAGDRHHTHLFEPAEWCG